MPDLDALNALIEPEVKAMGLALVRVAWLPNGGMEGNEPTLQIMAERSDTRQLVIEDCAALSRRISDKFDAMEEAGNDPIEVAYRLEVSSPGIDRPLTRLSDFADWQGHEAKVEVQEEVGGRKRLRGDLIGVEGNDILLEDKKIGAMRFSFSLLDNAKLVLTDRLIASSAPVSSDGVDTLEEETDDFDA